MERDDSASGHDVIRLVGLGGVGRHGVLEEERRDGQTFLVDLALHLDTSAAAASDDLEQTVNYADVAASVVALIEGEPVRLIETLASRIAGSVLAHDLVHSVEVTVHKPEAPVGVPFTDVQVSIRRSRTAAGTPGAFQAEPAGQAAAPVAAPAQAGPAAVAVPASASGSANEGVPEPEPAHDGNGHGADLDREPGNEVDVVLALGGNVGDVRATLRAVVDDLREAPGLEVQTVSPLARTAAVLEADAVAQQDYLNAVVLATTTLSPNALLDLTQSLEASYGRQRQERWGERTLDIDLITYDGVTSSEEHLALPHPRANERAFVLVPWTQADPDAFLPGLGGGPVAVLAETAPDRSGVRWLALDWLEHTGHRSDSGSFVVKPKAAPAPSDQPGTGAPAEAPAESSPVDQVSDSDQPAGGVSAGEVPAAQAYRVPAAAAAAEPGEGSAEPEGEAGDPASRSAEQPAGPRTPERGLGAGEAEPAVIEPDTGMPPAFEPDAESAGDDAPASDNVMRPISDSPSEPELARPDSVPAPEPTPQPETGPAPRPETGMPPAVEPDPVQPEPEVEQQLEPTPEPVPTPVPEPQPQPEPESELSPVADPESGPTPEPESTPEAQPGSDAGAEAVQQTSVAESASETADGAKDAPSADFRPRWQPLRGDQDT